MSWGKGNSMRVTIATVEVELGWRHLAEAALLAALIWVGMGLVFCFG